MKSISHQIIHNAVEQIGKNVKKARKAQKLTQSELGNLCNLPKGTISRVENVKSYFSTYTLLKIVLALNIKPEEILDYGNNQESS